MDTKEPKNILIISDCSQSIRIMLEILASRGDRGNVVSDHTAARDAISSKNYELVICDISNPNEDYSSIVKLFETSGNDGKIIAFGDDNTSKAALQAVKAGFVDYLAKPLKKNNVQKLLESYLNSFDLDKPEVLADNGNSQIIGTSSQLRDTLRIANRIAPTTAPVLITGESGSGKELVATLIHNLSKRSEGPFVRINCAALNESLLESELFGHEKGAFTGAYRRREGCFERANGGTLLLDEISETPARLQAQLLRVLEQQDFDRVGGSESIKVNVRIISTSNRDLLTEIKNGRFREDLFYRLAGLHLTVPALRQRVEDIPHLVTYFTNLYSKESGRNIKAIDPKLLSLLASHNWPGNIRQLRNIVRSGLVMGDSQTLTVEDCSHALAQMPDAPKAQSDMPVKLQELEKRAIFEALRRTKSHQAKAARLLGITDRTLREKLRRYRSEQQEQEVMVR